MSSLRLGEMARGRDIACILAIDIEELRIALVVQ